MHILTIEDPIEYLHHHKRSAVNQREVGTDTDSFPAALRAALREDPDVLLLGEMRDPESIAAALTIAETGHLVFATLHTNDTSQTLDRIVYVFPAEQQPQIRLQLAHTLVGILNQTLIPRIGGGRVAAFEVLAGTSAIRNLRGGRAAHRLPGGHPAALRPGRPHLTGRQGRGPHAVRLGAARAPQQPRVRVHHAIEGHRMRREVPPGRRP
ncbi:type IV pilus twitching motility protein PilT [Streptomyces sp. NBC_00435]|uniref:type IV pilus twitching motility protein PilT n=1 Tax=Streptomyces sp. NBC_00435 TaxID=2903649 RepID=UPI002E1A444B